jgi:hypothetical protein
MVVVAVAAAVAEVISVAAATSAAEDTLEGATSEEHGLRAPVAAHASAGHMSAGGISAGPDHM